MQTLEERLQRRKAIMELYYETGLTMAQIGQQFGISRARVSRIISHEPKVVGRPRRNDDDPDD